MTEPGELGGAVPVTDVLVVTKCHLDVGFTDLAAAVRGRWLAEFLPRAMATAAELRAAGGAERMVWTTGSWILTEALETADATGRAALENAIAEGDLAWHALPFTTHTELADRSLLEHGLSLSARLDERFGRTTRAAKLTDVPGHTRGLVSLLAAAGVDLLHVGVNPAAPAPDVPERFRWRGAAAGAPEVMVMYQPGGYGATQLLEDGATAAMVEMTGDNVGPPSADDVRATWAALRERFPGARIRAATLDDVADALRPVRHELPMVTAEIGDTWIHGVASDPPKVAAFRELARRRTAWIATGRATPGEPAVARASTELLLMAEHTWGLDQKTHWPEEGAWSETELAALRSRPDTRRFEASWVEQRSYLDRFVERLAEGGRPDLADDARDGLRAAAPGPVSVEGLTTRHELIGLTLGPWVVDVDRHDGALIGLRRRDGARPADESLAGPDHPVGRVRHRTHSAADYERWFATYNSGTRPEDEWWARWDNTKPGLERSGARSAWYVPSLVGVWSGTPTPGRHVLVLEATFPDPTREASAAPPWLLFEWSVTDDDPDRLSLRLQWVAKPAARWPESTWLQLRPLVADPAGWSMVKLGEPVSPLDVVARGGRSLHAAERLVHPAAGVAVELWDAPLLAPGGARPLEFTDDPPDLSAGWDVGLYSNLWGTNFPMWCPGDASFRLDLRWTPSL
ncbi:MAG: DUF5054 domain-containing protein [Microthrixaceae bacterium]